MTIRWDGLATALATAALGLAANTGALAQAPRPAAAPQAAASGVAKTIQQRREAMVGLLSNMNRIEQMVYGMTPYKPAEAKAAADEMARLSGMVYALFPPGSIAATSKARPEIWEQDAAFAQAAAQSRQAVAALQGAAQQGTVDALKPVYAKVPPTCVACHSAFMRQP